MPIQLRPVESGDVEHVVAIALREQEGVRVACADSDMHVTVAVDGTDVLGFVAVLIDSATASGRPSAGTPRGEAQHHRTIPRERASATSTLCVTLSRRVDCADASHPAA